jgi:hypothetical protein
MHQPLLFAALAGVLALQAAPCQVSMSVTTTIGTVGQVCEPFQCLPHQTLASLGENLAVEVYGMSAKPYVLFVGFPGTYCQAIGGIAGELGMVFPIYTIQVGVIAASRLPIGSCNLTPAMVTVQVASYLPIGTQFRLQALSVDVNGPGFSRAVEIHTR